MISYHKRLKGKKEISEVKTATKNTWIRVLSPTEQEIQFLEEKFKLDKQLIHDALDQNELPRIEKLDKNIYIYLRIPRKEIVDEPTITLSVILTPENIITISTKQTGLYNFLEQQQTNIADTEEFIVKTLHHIFKKYNDNVREILKEVKKDRRNLSKLKNKDLLDLVLQEDVLNDYIAALHPMISMYDRILKLNVIKLESKEKEEIKDLIIDLTQTFDTCKLVQKTISNMRSYYSTMVSGRINDSITVLTLFTIFLTIPTVLSSIYGMNITLPLQNNPYTFWLLSGTVVIIWAILFKLFKRLNN